MIRNTGDWWGTPARVQHWVIAALVLSQIVLGASATLWRLSPLKLDLFVWHKSLGMLVLVLMALRLLWRVGNRTPGLPAGMPRWERRAARASHALLYVVLLTMPVTGWILNSAANVPVRLFWLIPLPGIVEPDETTEHVAKLAHGTLFGVLALLIVLHVAAALRHHYVQHDPVLVRMLRAPRSGA